jgi:transposase
MQTMPFETSIGDLLVMWLTGNLNIWLYSKPADMRKSIDGLSIIVSEQLEKNPCGPDVFVFYNNAQNKIKILYYDKNGFCLWYKRLEQGRFSLPKLTGDSYALSIEQLRWLLDGLQIEGLRGNPALHFEAYY